MILYYNKIYLASHILYKKGDDTIINLSQLNGKKLPPSLVRIIEKKAKEITYFHKWEKHDLIMLDNKRIMHGRNFFLKNEKREILNLQTLKTNIL